MLHISALPTEVLELVFWHLDGLSFGRCALVCKEWRNVFMNLDKGFWRTACQKEINVHVLEEMCGFQDTKGIKEKSLLWKNVYTTWTRGGMVKEFPFWTKHFSAADFAPVTCVKISGSWVLTGHRNGSVIAWKQLTGQMSHVLNQHLNMISDIAVIDILHAGPYGTIENHWDHHHIVSISKDPTVQVNSLLVDRTGIENDPQIVHHYSCALETIRVFGNTMVINASDNSILVFYLEYITDPVHSMKVTFIRQIIGPPENICCLNFWKDEVQCLCNGGFLKILTLSTNTWTVVKPYQPNPARREKLMPASNPYIFRNKTLFIRTAFGKMLVSSNGVECNILPLMSTIRCSIVSIVLRGSLLALGTETGRLLLYHVPAHVELKNINLAEPSWSVYFSEASIISIDISDDGESPVVVACTTDIIFVTKWYREEDISIEDREFSSILAC